MAWTNPRTAAVGDLYTAPWYNSEVRDNLGWVVRPLAAPLTTEVDVVSSAAETDLLNGLVTVPGGTLGTKGSLRATLLGDYRNNSGANRKLTLSIKVGGTTVWSDQTTDLPDNSARHDWTLEFLLAAKGTTIFLTGSWHYSTQGGATTGIGDASNATPSASGPTITPFGSNGTLGIDMASDRLLEVTAQHTASNASLSIRCEYAVFELVGQGAEVAWSTPVTAATGDEFTANWENGDTTRMLYVVRPLAVIADTVTIDATGNENDLLTTDPTGSDSTKRLILPAGWLGTKGMLRGTIIGDHLNNRGAGTTASITLRLKLGGTTLWGDTTDRPASDPHRHDFTIRFFIANCGAANSQFATGWFKFVESESANVGLGTLQTVTSAISGPYEIPFGSNGKAAVDTTVDQELQMTIQHQFAANMTTRMQWATVELVGQTA